MKNRSMVLIAAVLVLAWSGCKPAAPRVSQFSGENAARESFQEIAAVADSIFWHATDKCLRENSEGMKQFTKLEVFVAEQECEIIEVREVVDGASRTYVAIVKIHNPDFENAWYELTYEESGAGWQAIDGKLMSDGYEMNYFEGHFLSATNLKPYVDAATASQVKAPVKPSATSGD